MVTQLTGLTTTGANVFDTQIYPLDFTKLPALTVLGQSESIEPDNLHAPRDMERTTEFIITAYVRADTAYQDIIDTICTEVEAALSTDLTVNGLAKDVLLTDLLFDFEAGDQPIAKMDMTYNVIYRTKENNAEVST
jgi:hypothetical protein